MGCARGLAGCEEGTIAKRQSQLGGHAILGGYPECATLCPNVLGRAIYDRGLDLSPLCYLPFFVVVFAHFLVPGEELTSWKLLGMAVSFIGVAIIFSRELMFTSSSLWGGAAVIVSACSAGCANVVDKKYSQSINSTVNVVVQMGIGSLLLILSGLVLERGLPLNLDSTSILVILYLAVVGSAFAFAALYWLFTQMEVTKVSLFSFITPIVAVILGWLLLGERVGPNIAVGGSLILIGVVLVNRTSK
jgi:drug/metabolite transporter (DMT)-like permease